MLEYFYIVETENSSVEQLIEQIRAMKQKRDAVILAHYYVDGAIQDVADYVGDSYYLSRVAMEAPNKIIAFCGVRFMAESAKILSPDKTVLMPDSSAGCPMAHMIDESEILRIRAMHDDLSVVCYINSTARVKAASDVCVTSSNAKKIISKIDARYILFVPDRNLGGYLSDFFPDKTFILPSGFCPTHNQISAASVLDLIRENPGAKVLSHPECPREVIEVSDFVGSTSGIIYEAAGSKSDTFIICTEEGVGHQLRKDNPSKKFLFPSATPICPDMKKTTLQNLLDSLTHLRTKIEMREDLRKQALVPLLKMHELAG